MSNPSGPDEGNEPVTRSTDEAGEQTDSSVDQQPDSAADAGAPAATPSDEEPAAPDPKTEILASAATDPKTEILASAPPDPKTEILASAATDPETEMLASAATAPNPETVRPAERRFTAPSGFDARLTQKIDAVHEPATDELSAQLVPAGEGVTTEPVAQQKGPAPQHIPPRGDAPRPPQTRRSWGWVVAVLLVIAALVAIVVLGTVLLTRHSDSRSSREDQVRSTIENFDIAIQKGDLTTLRSITCGTTRDDYVDYDEGTWAKTYAQVSAAKQYPVVASIDQVVVNGDHAEANVTTFMAYAPQMRSTRSFDLQFRDGQWKICQAPA